MCETNPQTLASTEAGTVSFHVFESMSYPVICVMEEAWMTYTLFLLMLLKVT